MFVVTETAGNRLLARLSLKQRGDCDAVLRFVRKAHGWKLRVGKPAVGDITFAHAGRTVLVLDERAAELLVNRTLDTKDSPTGSKFCLR